MATLSTNKTFKGNGLKWNVRSYRFERTIDFAEFDFTASTYFEIGDLPAGFIPRALGIVELKKPTAAATLGVYLGGDYTSAASELKLAERTLGTAAGNTFALMTKATEASSAITLAPVGVGGTLCAHVNSKPTDGLVKIVVSGDMMTGVWDDGVKRGAHDPAEIVSREMEALAE